MSKPIPMADTAFWARVDKTGDCWIWQQAGGPATTYGQWRGSPTNRVALNSREALPTIRRKLDPGERSFWQALHHCDNPPCVNPDHLYWGTAGRNADDRAERHPKCEYVSIMWGRRCRGVASHDLGDLWACAQHNHLVVTLGRIDIPTIYDAGDRPPVRHLALSTASFAACGRRFREDRMTTSWGLTTCGTCRRSLTGEAVKRAEKKREAGQ